MEKMTQRGNLPTSYDLRIRIDEPFNKTTTKKRNKILDNKLSKTQESKSPKSEKSKVSFKKYDEFI
jgi:hypothetical protein